MPKSPVLTRRRRFNVPVDRFEIVNGPGWRRWQELIGELTFADEIYMYFTIRTAASSSSFSQRMRLISVQPQDGTYFFTAICSGAIVAGYYDPRDQTGWFNEE